jgi:4-amino-4-deoxy-L-arabinose transferase-like glycosyltransferase
MNPPLGKLFIGVSLLMAGAPSWHSLYDFSKNVEENAAIGRVPPLSVLQPARIGIACFGALCCGLLFILGLWVAGPLCGFLASGLLLFNATFVELSTQVMTDTPLAAFLLLMCLATARLMMASDNDRRTRFALLIGLAIGCAASIKIHGLLIGVGTVGACLLIGRHQIGLRQVAVTSAKVITVAIATGYLVSPNYWPQLGEVQVGSLRAEVAALQTAGIPQAGGEEGRFGEFKTRYPQLANITRPLRMPFLFVRWKVFLDALADRRIPSWGFGEHRTVAQARRLFAEYATFHGQVVLVAIGLVLLVIQSRARDHPARGAAVVALMFFLVNYALILLFQRVNWNRYYFQTILSYQVPAAAGMAWVAGLFGRWAVVAAAAASRTRFKMRIPS